MSLRSELMELIKRIALGHRDHEHRLRELELRTAGMRYYQVAVVRSGVQEIDNNPLQDYDVYRQDLTLAMAVRHTWASGNANGHQVGARSSILIKTRTIWFALDGITVIREIEQTPITDSTTTYSGEINRVTPTVIRDTVGTNLNM